VDSGLKCTSTIRRKEKMTQWGVILFKVHPSKIGFKLDSASPVLEMQTKRRPSKMRLKFELIWELAKSLI
jgi:hypothetical protein